MEDRNFVTALARGLDILRCFDQPGVELSVSEIARRVGLNQATAWRLCHTLLECGFLVRASSSAHLRIGAPAVTLGFSAIDSLDFPQLAHPYMKQLAEKTRATITLTIQSGIEIISVQRCDGDFVLPNQPIGWRTLLTSVPSGLCIIATMPPASRQTLLQRIESHAPKDWPRRAARVEQAMADFARDGYLINSSMLDDQYFSVAVPIVAASSPSQHAWAMSCGGLMLRWPRARLEEAGRDLLRVKGLLQPLVERTNRYEPH